VVLVAHADALMEQARQLIDLANGLKNHLRKSAPLHWREMKRFLARLKMHANMQKKIQVINCHVQVTEILGKLNRREHNPPLQRDASPATQARAPELER